LALGKKPRHAHRTNLEAEGHGEEKSKTEFLMQMYKREIKYKSD
jgi:hypothetical protein